MDDQQVSRSAWPDPPTYFKRYTDENLELLKQAKKTDTFPEQPISSAYINEFQLEALDPPLPPTDEYTVFDQNWKVKYQ
jgi:mediator of RNA polymerase II transcription subunit 7